MNDLQYYVCCMFSSNVLAILFTVVHNANKGSVCLL